MKIDGRVVTIGGQYPSEYRTWASAKSRCTNPKDRDYPDYGGRGIKMCLLWQSSFEAFLADVGRRPSGMILDRKDNDGNYEPGNCRWVNAHTSSRNTRWAKKLTHDGKTQCLSAWAKDLGISPAALHYRIYQFKWPLGKALTTARPHA